MALVAISGAQWSCAGESGQVAPVIRFVSGEHDRHELLVSPGAHPEMDWKQMQTLFLGEVERMRDAKHPALLVWPDLPARVELFIKLMSHSGFTVDDFLDHAATKTLGEILISCGNEFLRSASVKATAPFYHLQQEWWRADGWMCLWVWDGTDVQPVVELSSNAAFELNAMMSARVHQEPEFAGSDATTRALTSTTQLATTLITLLDLIGRETAKDMDLSTPGETPETPVTLSPMIVANDLRVAVQLTKPTWPSPEQVDALIAATVATGVEATQAGVVRSSLAGALTAVSAYGTRRKSLLGSLQPGAKAKPDEMRSSARACAELGRTACQALRVAIVRLYTNGKSLANFQASAADSAATAAKKVVAQRDASIKEETAKEDIGTSPERQKTVATLRSEKLQAGKESVKYEAVRKKWIATSDLQESIIRVIADDLPAFDNWSLAASSDLLSWTRHRIACSPIPDVESFLREAIPVIATLNRHYAASGDVFGADRLIANYDSDQLIKIARDIRGQRILAFTDDERGLLHVASSVESLLGAGPEVIYLSLMASAEEEWKKILEHSPREAKIFPDLMDRFRKYAERYCLVDHPIISLQKRGWIGLTLGAIVHLERGRLHWKRKTAKAGSFSLTKWCREDLEEGLSESENLSLLKWLNDNADNFNLDIDGNGKFSDEAAKAEVAEEQSDRIQDLRQILSGKISGKSIDATSCDTLLKTWKRAVFLLDSNQYEIFMKNAAYAIEWACDRKSNGQYLRSDFAWFDNRDASVLLADSVPTGTFTFGSEFGAERVNAGITLATVDLYAGLGRYATSDTHRPGLEIHASAPLDDPGTPDDAAKYTAAQILLPTAGLLTVHFHPWVRFAPAERMIEAGGPRGRDVLKSYLGASYDQNFKGYFTMATGGKVIQSKRVADGSLSQIDSAQVGGSAYAAIGVDGGFIGPDKGPASFDKRWAWFDIQAFLHLAVVGPDSFQDVLSQTPGVKVDLGDGLIPSAGGKLRILIKQTLSLDAVVSAPLDASDRKALGGSVWAVRGSFSF